MPQRLIFLALSTVCAVGFTIQGPGEQPPGVPSATGLVVCVSAPACDAGAAVLARGGNAVDAAVATGFALAVTHPAAGNIGGGGFMVIRLPNGRTTAFDFREKAPRRSTPTMYLDAAGNIDRTLTATGYLAPGIPGTVRGFAAAHKKFGKLPWREVLIPGVTLAEQGFPLSESLARSLNAELKRMAPFPASVAAYGKPGGGEWAPGDRLVLTDLGRALRAIATDGPDAFYKGWIADRIATDMQAHGGLITRADLAAYRAKERTPVKGTYRGFDIISMPPPSSGGVALIEMLNILEPLNLKSLGLLTPPALHAQIEAMRRAYLDRARYLGDPDFSRVPVSRLIAKAHAREVASSIDSTRASRSGDLGQDLLNRSATEEPDETTHFSVVDRQGLAVATTYTLEGGFGSHVVVTGAGFILNNEMGDFNRKPGLTNETGDIGTPANTIAPGKRMLSSMTPTILSRDRKLVLITGSPGGRTIINTVLTVVLGVTEYGLSGREAVDLVRLHHQWMPDRVSVEEKRVPDETLERLRALGHEVRTGMRQGDAHSIWIGPDGQAYGINDTRSPDSKASVAGPERAVSEVRGESKGFDSAIGRAITLPDASRGAPHASPSPRSLGRGLAAHALTKTVTRTRTHRGLAGNSGAFFFSGHDMDYSKLDGLIPAVVQDDRTGEVLMVGFMNDEALRKTRETGFATFFSRTRGALWTKGETSGNRLEVKRILVDCDEDTVLLKVVALGDGVACHTGERSCFYRELTQ